MTRRMVGGTWLALALLAAPPVWAQTAPERYADRVHAWTVNNPTSLEDYARVDLAIKKSGVQTKALLLDRAEREAFLPIYEQYQREWAELNHQREALLTEYINGAKKLDDDAAKTALAKFFEVEEQRVGLLKQYAEALKQTLPTTLVIKFVEAELHIQNLTDVQLSGRLPDFR